MQTDAEMRKAGEMAARQGLKALEMKAKQLLMAITISEVSKYPWMAGFIATLETEFPKLLMWARQAKTEIGR